jgi:hypothetical protein
VAHYRRHHKSREEVMNSTITISAIALAASLSLMASQASTQTIETAGVVCWTGDIEFMGTTDKDMGWVWTVDWTYTSDDKDMQRAATGRCLGSGGMIDGKPEASNEYCIHNRQDGATFMSQGQSSAKGSKATMFGGTGALAGVAGGWTGGERIQLPVSDGKLAGCRVTAGEYTLN